MLRGSFTRIEVKPSEKRGNSLLRKARSETDCTGILPDIARLIWPKKTAIHWAAEAGVGERMAKYWLSKKHPVSDTGRRAIVRLID